MAKIKVHELAKELEIKSKDVITFLQEKGVDVKAAVRSKGQQQDRAGSADRKEGAGGESGNGRKDDADCGSTG